MSLKAKGSAYLICSRQIYDTSDRVFLGVGRQPSSQAPLALLYDSRFSFPALSLPSPPLARWGVGTQLRSHTPMWALVLPLAGFVSRAGELPSQPSFLSWQRREWVFLFGLCSFYFFSFSLLLFFPPLILFQKSSCGWILAEINTWCIAFHSYPPAPKNKCSTRPLARHLDEEGTVENKRVSPAWETQGRCTNANISSDYVINFRIW